MGYCYTRESALCVLADGMGGHPEGDVAAQLAVDTVSAMYQQQATPLLGHPGDFLVHALLAAHRRILRYAEEHAMVDTPRTTLVVAVLQADHVHWVHCGDSRLYLVRDAALLTRTRDHSYSEQLAPDVVRMGQVNRNMLFTCLGSPTPPVYHLADPQPLRQGDKLLLCSDGLWASVPEPTIVRLLGGRPVGEAVPELVERALRQAGDASDNVTALALEWDSADAFCSTRGPLLEEPDPFAVTVQSLDPQVPAPVMDEETIERSIAEINATIRRTAARRS